MPAEFDVSCASDGRVEVVTVKGEVDLLTVPRIEPVLQDCLAKPDAHVLADYRGVDFLDSIGVRLIIDTWRTLDQQGRRLVLVSDKPAILKLFTHGIDRLVPVEEDFDRGMALAAGATPPEPQTGPST